MVRIEDKMKAGNDHEDIARQEAEQALSIANEHDGGNIGDLTLLLRMTSPDAVYGAIQQGWLERDGRVVHITTAGRDYYLQHLKAGSRHPLDFSEADSRRTDIAIIEAGLVHVLPKEYTIYADLRIPKSKKIDEQ